MPWLDKVYCPIGQMLEGEGALDSLKQGDKLHRLLIYWQGIDQALAWKDVVIAWEMAEKEKQEAGKKSFTDGGF